MRVAATDAPADNRTARDLARAGAAKRDFALLFAVMLVSGAGNTALQSVMPAIGRSLRLPDSAIALAFSASAIVWVLAAPMWARRSDRTGRKRMVLLGMAGFGVSSLIGGLFLTAGISGAIAPVTAIVAFIVARLIYGFFGSAAPPAAQAIVAAQTSRAGRTKALTLLASAFGVGTIVGPAVAPFLLLPVAGLAGPTFVFAAAALVVGLLVWRRLSDDAPAVTATTARGAASSYPSIGSNLTGASVTAAVADASSSTLRFLDPRIRPWMLLGLGIGHAQVMVSQAIGFLVLDRLGLAPLAGQQSIGLVLMVGAGGALLVQWGVIPLLDLRPRTLVVVGLALSAVGCALIPVATTLHALALAFAIACAGFGFARPGFTAGASLAVGPELQGSLAGRVTSVNGASLVLGPSIGIGLYEAGRHVPYFVAAVSCLALIGYATQALRTKKRADPKVDPMKVLGEDA